MKTVYISGESIQGKSYKSFINYLLDKSDVLSYETLKMSDIVVDADDKKYYDSILRTEKIFCNFYKKKDIDERGTLKSFVYLKNSVVKDYIKRADSIYHWNYPNDIENLCFFKNDKLVFESVTHEDYFAYYPDNETEIEALKEYGIVCY